LNSFASNRMPHTVMWSSALLLLSLYTAAAAFSPSGLLEIHYINVQCAGATLVIGPNGTTMLMDGGNDGDGNGDIIPYFNSIGLLPSDDLNYMVAGHLDGDHIGGLDEVIYGGYNVLNEVYYNGSTKSNSLVTAFFNAAATTTAGPAVPMALGTTIQLGDGATAICVAVHGNILGGGSVSVSEENDKSIALLIRYGEFEFLWASDLGGGEDDQWCTGRNTATNYANVETPLAQSLRSPSGANLLGVLGVEILHVNHHGSESSTNKDYMNLLTPRIACINVGGGQASGWDFPRIDILDNVLRALATACVTAPPAIVLQTEEGAGSPGDYRSYNGYAVGDIVIKTNGQRLFHVSASGRVNGGPDERAILGLPRYYPLDEDTSDHVLPAAVTNLFAGGGPLGNQITLRWTAPGDDGNSGRAALYDIRYRSESFGPIDSENEWNAATRISNLPYPKTGGAAETLIVSGLVPGQSYYFALKSTDDNLNVSLLSNSPRGTAGAPACSYVLGDINGDGSLIGSDATYGVRFFKAIGAPPPDSCYLDSSGAYVYVAGDVNGNCEFRGSDITRLVNYFKGSATLEYCPYFPPQ